MPVPEGVDLLAFLGQSGDDEEQADQHVRSVMLMVKAYTRGRGFLGDQVEDDVAAVIVTAAGRLYSNPVQTVRVEAGNHSEVPGLFNGFTLPELAVLHRYRRRTA